MRTFLIVLSIASLAPSVAGAADARHAFSDYRSQLARQCPAKHLAQLSPADLRDTLDTFKARVSTSVSREMSRAEARRCASSPGGAACPNAADLDVIARHHLIADLAVRSCDSYAICRGQSDCDAISTGDDEPQNAAQIAEIVRRDGPGAAAAALTDADMVRATAAASSGHELWMRDLVAIRPATDGARSESIDLALSFALATDPAEVLRLARAHPATLRPDSLCEYRAIEPKPADAAAFVDRATAALQRVDDPRLAALRDRCVADLHRTS